MNWKTFFMGLILLTFVAGLYSCNGRRNTAKKRYKRVKGCNCSTFSQLQFESANEIFRIV